MCWIFNINFLLTQVYLLHNFIGNKLLSLIFDLRNKIQMQTFSISLLLQTNYYLSFETLASPSLKEGFATMRTLILM